VHLKGILFQHAVDGLVTKPDLLIFVNRRPVTNLAIMSTVCDIYAMVKSQATNMVAFLFLDFQGNFIDCNVHPQKKALHFKSDYLVKIFLENATTDALPKKIGQFHSSGREFDMTFRETPSSVQFVSTGMSRFSKKRSWNPIELSIA
jgi:DNA mismatch repair ATPase MutL